jgi:hypothetical protein
MRAPFATLALKGPHREERHARRPDAALGGNHSKSGPRRRHAYGCNIGAYFSGVASPSLHGWLWFMLAFLGSIIGTGLRPLFGLPVERSRAGGC